MICGGCGATLRDPLEFHPPTFCEMRARHQWPWVEMNKLHPGRLPSRPPVLKDYNPAKLDSLLAMAAYTEKATCSPTETKGLPE